MPEFTWLFTPEKSKVLTLQAKHYVLNVDYFPLEIMTGIVISRKSHYFIPLKTLFFLLLEEFLSIIYEFWRYIVSYLFDKKQMCLKYYDYYTY